MGTRSQDGGACSIEGNESYSPRCDGREGSWRSWSGSASEDGYGRRDGRVERSGLAAGYESGRDEGAEEGREEWSGRGGAVGQEWDAVARVRKEEHERLEEEALDFLVLPFFVISFRWNVSSFVSSRHSRFHEYAVLVESEFRNERRSLISPIFLEMDDFFSPESKTAADPTSDFLAREKAALGADATFGETDSAPEANEDFTGSAYPDLDGGEDDLLAGNAGGAEEREGAEREANNEFAAFENQFPEVEVSTPGQQVRTALYSYRFELHRARIDELVIIEQRIRIHRPCAP